MKIYGLGFNYTEWFFYYFFLRILGEDEKKLTIVGSWPSSIEKLYIRIKPADYFITGENMVPKLSMAKKHIGFWPESSNKFIYRFPNWKWHLAWNEIPSLPPYGRFGERLIIDLLMSPISERYSQSALMARSPRAVLVASHMGGGRDSLYELVNHAMGCEGYGKAFNLGFLTSKKSVLERYTYCFCPENVCVDGYVTEKIPEAFYAGCIPITWAHPNALRLDFNPKAVINLYGLAPRQIAELLCELSARGNLYRSLINEPLLLIRPKLEGLIEFVKM